MIAAYPLHSTTPHRVDHVIQRDDTPGTGGAWFYLYASDSFNQIRYLVAAPDLESAVEWLTDDPTFTRANALAACDLADYPDDDEHGRLTWNERGDAFDLEALAGWECTVRVVRGDYWSDVIGPAAYTAEDRKWWHDGTPPRAYGPTFTGHGDAA